MGSSREQAVFPLTPALSLQEREGRSPLTPNPLQEREGGPARCRLQEGEGPARCRLQWGKQRPRLDYASASFGSPRRTVARIASANSSGRATLVRWDAPGSSR